MTAPLWRRLAGASLGSLLTCATSSAAPIADGWPERLATPGTPIERVARPLALSHTCRDRRYPRLAGPYVVHCGPGGVADQVLDLSTGRTADLLAPASAYAVHHGQLYAYGRGKGVWTLPAERPEGPSDAVDDAVTPPAWDGVRVAYGGEDFLAVFTPAARRRVLYEATPAPWYSPALAGEWIVWTEMHGGSPCLRALHDRRAVLFADGPGPQHHPVGQGPWLAWVDGGDVVIADVRTEQRVRHHAESGFESAPALFGPDACWEDRSQGDLRVRCSDGWSVEGRHPSGGGPLTLVHTEDGPVLYAARRWPIQPERIEADGRGGAVIEVRAWWGAGKVEVQALTGEDWEAISMLELEAHQVVRVPVPLGVPIQVVPDQPIPRGLR